MITTMVINLYILINIIGVALLMNGYYELTATMILTANAFILTIGAVLIIFIRKNGRLVINWEKEEK